MMKIVEAKQNNKYVDIAITFKDLQELFEKNNIKKEQFKGKKANFDRFYNEYTKIYPISGALSSTSHLHKFFTDDEILVLDGVKNIIDLFEELSKGKRKERFFDILDCEGGCIGGNGIVNKDIPTSKRIKMIQDYRDISGRLNMEENMGKMKHAKDISFWK